MEESKLSLKLLYVSLADEFLAWYQYWTASNTSEGKGKADADPEFEQHAKEEMEHAEKVMERIKQLGGVPFNHPCDWTNNSNPWSPVETRDVTEQLKLTIGAESAAIRFYSNAVRATESTDITTCQLFKELLADEQEHLYDLQQLLKEQESDRPVEEPALVVLNQ